MKKIKSIRPALRFSMALALFLCGVNNLLATGGGTNYTQAILDNQGFPEGLRWIGTNEPSAEESDSLWNIVTNLSDASWTSAVEGFLVSYPASPWAASLDHAYASFCRRTGRITKALGYWEAGFGLASTNSGSSARLVGGMVLANWMELLSSLGRVEKLGELTAIGVAWPFGNVQDLEKFQGAQDCYRRMLGYPGLAFRCGTLALKAVGQSLQPANASLEDLVDIPSPTNGFSVAGLLTLAGQRGLDLVAVRRPEGTQLVVPSLVHWQQNHYAAILETNDGVYLVSDPTFGTVTWLTLEAINEEASGVFLVSSNSVPYGWSQLDGTEAAAIRGMGLQNSVKDGPDKGCPPGKKCPPCKGMPVWWVSEPYCNLWIADEPLSYLTSRGESFSFRMTYKQRDTRPNNLGTAPGNLIANAGWNHSWLSFILLTSQDPCPVGGCSFPSYVKSDATLFLPNGGEVSFPVNNRYDQETRLELQPAGDNSSVATGSSQDDGRHGLRVIHADGSQDIYGLSYGRFFPAGQYPQAAFLRTREIDPHGNTTWFNYENVGALYRLKNVVDYDGRTNTLNYVTVTGGFQLLSDVTNAYGLSAHFTYDANRNLTNIVDAAGLASSLKYDSNSYPTNLTTPYGTNRFDCTFITLGTNGNFGGHDTIDRSVRVTEPGAAISLYLYRYDSPSMPTNYAASDVPTNTPLGTLDDGTTATNTLGSVGLRNSFYWNPRQYSSLSTTNLNTFTTSDYLRGRMRHWLQDKTELFLTSLLSVERDPSPDGSIQSLKTFYDYQGKIYRHREGTNALPSVTAWRLPGGETHYDYVRYDEFGNVTNQTTTYTKTDGSLGTRTNQFLYGENTFTNSFSGTGSGSPVVNTFSVPNLLTRIVAADGSNVWTFGGFDIVSWTTTILIGTNTTNQVVLTSKRILPTYLTNAANEFTELKFTGFNKISSIRQPSGLTSTNLYNTSGFLSQAIDLETGRTNSFTYGNNGVIATFTNELALALIPTWDGLLRLTQLAFPDGSYISNRYDKLDITGRRDRLGNWTYFNYDGLDHLIATTNANNAVTRYVRCGCGTLETISNALNQATTLTHDNQSRCTAIQFADSSSASYQYDLAGRITLAQDGAGRPLTYLYNNQGLLTTVSNAYGRLESIVYDVRDRPIQFTDANNLTVTNTFDNLDRLLTRSWLGGGLERFGYSTNGLIAYTNQDSQVTRYARDAARRPTAVINANLETNQFGYNPAGQITNLVDGLNHTTVWHRNEFGWVTNKVDALNREIFRFAYDPNGRTTNRWTPEFGNTVFKHDLVGNLTNIVYPLSAIGYSYDALNRITNMLDAAGTTLFSYTAAGQLQSEDGPWSNDAVTYAYTQRLRSSMSLSNLNFAYGYDSAWRLTSLSSPAGSFGYGYGAPNSASALVRTLALPNLSSITNHYDTLARLDYTALADKWGHVLDGYAYTHDPLGLRTNIVRDFGLTTSSSAIGYDAIGQLISWSAKEPNGSLRLNEQLGFGYDSSDNLHLRTNGALVQTFTVDPVNELTNITRSGTLTVSGNTPAPATNIAVNGSAAERYGDFTFARTNNSLTDGNNTFTNIARNFYGLSVTNALTVSLPASVPLQFDSNGNLTNDGTHSFSYDPENQLTNITLGGQWKAEFVYDGLRRRRVAKDYGWNGAEWLKTNETRYVYDRKQAIQERNSSNVVLVTYTRGLDVRHSLQRAGGIGGLLARTDASGSTFYHADGAGNVTALMDVQENMVARYLYGPFGNLEGQWGLLADANVMRFSSMPRHGRSGLILYPRRPYQPELQRWLTSDPIGIRGGVNLHRFVRNNPLRYIDPLGLSGVAEGEPEPDLVPPEPEPVRYGPGEMPDEELMRAEEELLRRGAPSDMELREAEPEPESQGTWLSRLTDWIKNFLKRNPCPPEKPPFVIGRNMKDRVIPFAKKYGLDYYRPGPDLGSEAANLEANRAGFQSVLDSGRIVIDIGLDPANPNPSVYYNMESQMVNQNSVPAISFSGW